jgi:hypothetical protein
MLNPICLIKSLWLSLKLGEIVSGHNFIEQPNTPPNVQVLKCETCGHVSIAWDWTGFKGNKK